MKSGKLQKIIFSLLFAFSIGYTADTKSPARVATVETPAGAPGNAKMMQSSASPSLVILHKDAADYKQDDTGECRYAGDRIIELVTFLNCGLIRR